MRHLASLILCVGSGALMAGGFKWVFSQFGATDWLAGLATETGLSPEMVVNAASLAPALAWQVLLYRFWTNVAIFGFATRHGIVALVFAAASVLGSSGNLLLVFQSDAIRDRKVETAAAPAVDLAYTTAERMTSVAGRSAALREMSADKMAEEEATGGSCSNVVPQTGRGGIYDMRQRHAVAWNRVDDRLQQASLSLEEAVLEYQRSARSQDSLNQLQDAVMSVLRGRMFRDAVGDVEAMHRDMTSGWQWTNAQNETSDHTCVDAAYMRQIDPIQQELTEIEGTRLAGAYIDAVGGDDAFAVVHRDASEFIRNGTLGLGIYALIVAFCIDFLQAAAITRSVRDGRIGGKTPYGHDRVWSGARSLSAEEAARMKRAVGTILAQMQHDQGRALFVCANPPSEDECLAIAYLRTRGCRIVAANLPWRMLHGDLWLRVRASRFLPGCEFDLWTVPRDLHTEWARAAFGAEKATA